MNRRTFLEKATLSGAALVTGADRLGGAASSTPHEGKVLTVRGPIDPDQMGFTLPHEHVLVDMVGAGQVGPHRYDQDEAFELVLPYLRQARTLGCRTFVECTPSYIGKDAMLCRRLAEAADLHILTNVGYYGAVEDKFVPPHARTESADQLAARWVRDARGVDGTSIPAGFIKIGVDRSSLSEIDAKLVRAAARAHLQTGLLILSHTGYATPAAEQLAILREEGVHPSAWVWTHAQNEKDHEAHERAARAGAWIAFDGVRPETAERDVRMVLEMKRRGLLGHLHLSHDAGWYRPGSEQSYRAHDFIFREFLGKLRSAGLTEENIHLLTVENPKRAFTVEVRER